MDLRKRLGRWSWTLCLRGLAGLAHGQLLESGNEPAPMTKDPIARLVVSRWAVCDVSPTCCVHANVAIGAEFEREWAMKSMAVDQEHGSRSNRQNGERQC